MFDDLRIISYPDPRLRRVSVPVDNFGDKLGALVRRMFELMREAHGVGLAAAQVGHNIRLFIVSPTQNPEDDRVYVNPTLFDAEGEETSQEGCLSLPNINVDVVRAKSVKIRAQDAAGNLIEQAETDYVARIWQHELDHLNGILLVDHMGPTAKMENRKILKELEEKYVAENRDQPRRRVK
ncbi:MAG: peptide deformylase [Tepidisphaeraceae bacterium]